MPLAFAEPFLMLATTGREIVWHLQHYSQVVTAYITLETICSSTVSVTGLPSAHRGDVVYQDVKEPRYIVAKNVTSVFKLNVLNYMIASRAACKVYLR